MDHLISLLKQMKARIDGLMERLDISSKAVQASELEAQSSAPDFWNNPDTAQQVMQTLAKLKSEIERWQSVANRINDAIELAQLDDPSLLDELTTEVNSLTAAVDKMEFQALLSEPYDSENAIFAIHAGAGGTEAQDWAQMLEACTHDGQNRMVTRSRFLTKATVKKLVSRVS